MSRSFPDMRDRELPQVRLRQELLCLARKKKKRIGAMRWQVKAAHKIQPREHSRGGDSDGVLHNGALWLVYANWNSDNRYWNANAYPVSNPNAWNEGNQVFSSYSCIFSSATTYFTGVLAEVLFSKSFLQPPMILPIFSISPAMAVYCSLETKRDSQSSCIKKRRASTLSDA